MTLTATATQVTINGGLDSGTFNVAPSLSGAELTVTDTTKSWTVNEMSGRIIYITGGTGGGSDIVTTAKIHRNTATTLIIASGFVGYNATLNTLEEVLTDTTSTYSIAHNLQDLVDGGYMTKDSNNVYSSVLAWKNIGYFGDLDKTFYLNHYELFLGFFDQTTFGGGKYQFGYIDPRTLNGKGGCSVNFEQVPSTIASQPGSYIGIAGGQMNGFDSSFISMTMAIASCNLKIGGGVTSELNVPGFMRDVRFLEGVIRLTKDPDIRGIRIEGGEISIATGKIHKGANLGYGAIISSGSSEHYYNTDFNYIQDIQDTISWANTSSSYIYDMTSVKVNTFDSSLSILGGIKYNILNSSNDDAILSSIDVAPYTPITKGFIETDVNGIFEENEDIDLDKNLLVIKRRINKLTTSSSTILEYGPFVTTSGKYGYKAQKKNITYDSPIIENLYFDVNNYVSANKTTAGTYSSRITIDGVAKTITITADTSLQELYDYSQYWFFDSDNMKYDEPYITADGNNFTSTYDLIITDANLTGTGLIDISAETLTFNGTGNTTNIIKYSLGTYTNISFTGLQSNSEVRIYRVSDDVELSGVENSGTSFTYKYTWSVDTPVYVMIHNIQYNHLKIEISLIENKLSIPIQQIFDRNYNNP